jgi:hypothetical protein
MPTVDQLRQRYASATDEELRLAIAAGVGAYTPDAWSVLEAERARRQLTVEPDAVEAEAEPEAPVASPEPVAIVLSDLAQRGEAKLRTVSGLVMMMIVVVGVLEMIAGTTVVPAVVRVLLGVALVIKGREGRRWAVAGLAFIAAVGAGTTGWMLAREWTTFDVDGRLLFGGITAAWLAIGLALVGSPSIHAYLAERQPHLKKQTIVF